MDRPNKSSENQGVIEPEPKDYIQEELLNRMDRVENRLEKFYSRLSGVDGQVDSVDNRMAVVMREIDLLHDKLEGKASKQMVGVIDSRFQLYAEVKEFNALKKTCLDFAKKEKVAECEQKIDTLQESIKECAKTSEVYDTKEYIMNFFKKEFKECVKKRELHTSQTAINKAIEKLRVEIKEEMSVFDTFKKNLDLFKRNLKEDKLDLEAKINTVWDNFNNYCDFNHFDNYKASIKPMLRACELRVDKYGVENEKCVKIIQRFDEVLCQKASKFNFGQLEKDMKNYLKAEEFNEKFLEVKKELRNFEVERMKFNSKIDEIGSSVKQMIANSIIKISKEAKNQLIDALGGKPVEPGELISLLKLKANVEVVEDIQINKADKAQIESTTSVLEIFHSQITHLCMILKDFLKLHISQMTKEDQATKKKIDYYYKYACTLSKWIRTNEEQEAFKAQEEESPREVKRSATENKDRIDNFLFKSTSNKPIHIRPLTSTSNRKEDNIKYDSTEKISTDNLDLSIFEDMKKRRLQSASSRRISLERVRNQDRDLKISINRDPRDLGHHNSLMDTMGNQIPESQPVKIKANTSFNPVNFTKIKAQRISQKGRKIMTTNVKKFNHSRLSYTSKNTTMRYKKRTSPSPSSLM
ncbi:unnamed protein product [Moneuplotes crassus]|uniref:Uncharacterized protein n=1 Tax=Euplotes crassus TaxID=5936 RepID=A0AAD1X6L0_EUPCR|nr:unnamed protein product [Moneuplotes crassus]